MEYEKLAFTEKVGDNWYVEKYILVKVGKHNHNIACMLNFYLGNQNTTLENIILIFKNLMQNNRWATHNQASQVLKIRPLNITLLPKNYKCYKY